MKQSHNRCPCGAGHLYERCCGIWHAGLPAGNAASLMRSRYSAFVLRDAQYLLATWHPSRRPLQIAFDSHQTWLGLTVIEMHVAGADAAEVEFIARSRIGASPEIRHHERSRFVREGGVWLYVDGVMK